MKFFKSFFLSFILLALSLDASATNGYSLSLRKAKADAVTTAVGNAGILTIYSGTQPATGGALNSNTALATITLGSPFADPATGTLGGSVLINPKLPAATAATASGTATWYRITTASGTFVADGTISATGGGGDLQLTTVSITTGLLVQLTNWSIGVGNP